MSPTQADPISGEAMGGERSSMATPSSEEGGGPGLPAVPESPEGRIGLEEVGSTRGGGLQRAQKHQEVDGGGSGLELVPARPPKVYGPATSVVEAAVRPFFSACGGWGWVWWRKGAG